MKYLVVASEGPGFSDEEQAVRVLESAVMPTFDRLIELEEEGKIDGGLLAASRSFVFIMEAASNDEVDRVLRDLPLWGSTRWDVTPLQTLKARAEMEREVLGRLK